MQTSTTTLRKALFGIVACGLLGIGCSSAPQSTHGNDAPATPSSAAKGVNGTLLYEKTLGAQHTIDFFDFGDATAVRETLSMDNGEVLFMSHTSFTSMADLYVKLNPGATPPPLLAEADQRAAVLAKKIQPYSQAGTSSGHASPVGQEILSGADGCSADESGDGWSGQWFINNACTRGWDRWCQQNWGSAFSSNANEYMAYVQLEGDFNVEGTMLLCRDTSCNSWSGCEFRSSPCSGGNLIMDVNQTVPPRQIVEWDYNPASHVGYEGSSRCGHLDIAIMGSKYGPV